MFAYYLVYWIGVGTMEASLLQAVILTSATVCLPLIAWMSRRWEKRTAFAASMASWAVVMAVLLFLPQGATVPAYIVAVLVGPGVAAAHVLPTAMGADALDVDELASGKRQEGIYSGFDVFVRKLSTKLVLAGIGPLLAWSGYVENAERQTASALLTIRGLISIAPAVALLGAIVVARAYPLTRARHREIQAELTTRRTAGSPSAESGLP
jgi:GPH family glycoside/pentoside/hexuronide:cation symporter